MATNPNSLPFLPPVRITSSVAREALEIRRCLNPGCKAVLPEKRTIPLCVGCAAGVNRDDKKTMAQLVEANERDVRRQGRRQLMLVNETSHVMSLPKNVREEVRRREFNVRGFVRITRRVIIDVRK